MQKIIDKIKHYFEYEFLTGHISFYLFSWRISIYGRNAMHWGITINTRKWGYICFRLPLPCCGKFWPLYYYISPNATPWASTFMLGKKHDRHNYALSRLRKYHLGHNFNTDNENTYKKLRLINTFYPDVNKYVERD